MNRKNQLQKWLAAFAGLLLIGFSSCDRENEYEQPLVPVITEPELFSVGSDAVTLKSVIRNFEGSDIASIGILWGTAPEPTDHFSEVTGLINDTLLFCRVEGLSPNTTYYARFVASNSAGAVYSQDITFVTINTLTDIDGNVYNTVRIGDQVWMAENLKTTKYNDGTAIPLIGEPSAWLNITTAGYCWYNNEAIHQRDLGALYNGLAALSDKLCPKGWHVPSEAEWKVLANYLEVTGNIGGALKATEFGWNAPNLGATNFSGFSAVAAGNTGSQVGGFSGAGMTGLWWSSTIAEDILFFRRLWVDSNELMQDGVLAKGYALSAISVRCIKD